ncbi:polysaccharide biosynthesis/export family protein [Rhizobium mongolense]|uniref:Polysaccharide export outer membrane protein/exopolysaccharide production protein ExoF n=2 Tax=Rhizobium mongolense TaxID=57676 RepID=A0ABR6IX07_9HYPH|nr:polysaccharide biosynthesis/export family protein [Rhizobium mongolense]MBB4231979.1 polysaccharide export outer membrane protein/exopolysaccharide production protein ExoF [Rhizobium mongolense]TVZ66927.1 polysaccharide export outer membrane protein/exopolysaccharide production protein ExoF [Rhizobium mongolense USDA 1844]
MPIAAVRNSRTALPGARRVLRFIMAAGIIGTAFTGQAVHAADDSYRIRAQTRMKVSVVEWVSSTGEYKEWTALNGEYTVSQRGDISMPMVGQIAVLGKTTEETAFLIGEKIKKLTGLATAPIASVEIAKYPMVYVTGAVERPNEFEFRPGLTVKQALALAGGRERRNDRSGEYADAEQIRYAGEFSRLELQAKQLMARRARLIAELNDKPSVDFPAELTGAPEGSVVSQILKSESALFTARADALRHQLESAADLMKLLRSEITVLDEKMVAQDRQVEIAQDELGDISKLVDTKILTTSRKTSLERIVADMQSDKLDLVVASMQAKQKLNETEREALNLKGQRKTEVGQELQVTEAELEDVRLKRSTTVQLLQAAGASVARYESLQAVDMQPLEYWLTRGAGRFTAAPVPDSAELEPGDVLDVRYNVSKNLDGSMLSSANPPPRVQ